MAGVLLLPFVASSALGTASSPNAAWLQRDQPSPSTFPPSHSAFLTFNCSEIKSALFWSRNFKVFSHRDQTYKGSNKRHSQVPGPKRSEGAAASSRAGEPRCSCKPPGRLPSRPPRPLPWKLHTASWVKKLSKALGSWPSWVCHPLFTVSGTRDCPSRIISSSKVGNKIVRLRVRSLGQRNQLLGELKVTQLPCMK